MVIRQLGETVNDKANWFLTGRELPWLLATMRMATAGSILSCFPCIDQLFHLIENASALLGPRALKTVSMVS